MAQEAAAAASNGTATKPVQKAGLEDIVAGQSSICFLDGKNGILAYRGYDIHDLVKGSFEETAYLLFYGKLPNKSELDQFNQKLIDARKLPQSVKDSIKNLPKNVHPMAPHRDEHPRTLRSSGRRDDA
jgi:citrate synthase